MTRGSSPTPSEKQLAVIDFIIRYVEEHGFQPTRVEIATALGVTKNTITYRLRQLAWLGLVKDPSRAERSVCIKGVKYKAVDGNNYC